MFPIRNAVPSRYPPLGTWTLIAANCVVFLFQISLSPAGQDEFLLRFALIPARYVDLMAGEGLMAIDVARREFIAALIGTAVTWPLAASAQQRVRSAITSS